MNNKKSELQENKMGTMPINKLLLSMSIPIMISMLIQALYNIIDSVFVAQISEDALNAVSLAFPMQNLMISVSIGTCIGMNALLSKNLGEKNIKQVQLAANNGIFLSFISFILFALIGIFFSRTFYENQTNISNIINDGTSYLQICFIFSFGIFGQICFERLLQSTGKTLYTMITQSTGAIINIILDPILIFGLGPFPKMGVSGAAVATVTGQIIAFILSLLINHFKNKEIKLKIKGFKPNLSTIKRIYIVGIPSIIMLAISSLMIFAINKILLSFTPTATAVFGAYFKLQSFAFMPVFGLNNGMVPIIAYNFGAKNPDRIRKTLKLSVYYSTIIMLVCLIPIQLYPEILLKMFKPTENMLAIGIPALKIISTSFIFVGFSIMSCSYFQALGHGMLSLFVSILRQLIVLLPFAYILSKLNNLTYVWLAFPISELAGLILCIIFVKYIDNKEIKPIEIELTAKNQ